MEQEIYSSVNATELCRLRCVCKSWLFLTQFATHRYTYKHQYVYKTCFTTLLMNMSYLVKCDVTLHSEDPFWNLVVHAHSCLEELSITNSRNVVEGGSITIHRMPRLSKLELICSHTLSGVSPEFNTVLIDTPKLECFILVNVSIPTINIPSSITKLELKNITLDTNSVVYFNLNHCVNLNVFYFNRFCYFGIIQSFVFESQSLRFFYVYAGFEELVCNFPQLEILSLPWTYDKSAEKLTQTISQYPNLKKLFMRYYSSEDKITSFRAFLKTYSIQWINGSLEKFKFNQMLN